MTQDSHYPLLISRSKLSLSIPDIILPLLLYNLPAHYALLQQNPKSFHQLFPKELFPQGTLPPNQESIYIINQHFCD